MSEQIEPDNRAFCEAGITGMLDSLYGAALRLTRNSADAEDLVADTVVKALASCNSLADRSRFRGWVFRILSNTFLSNCRKRGTRAEVPMPEEGTDDDGGSFWLFDRLHQPFLLWWGNPEQAFLDHVLATDIERAIHGLPEVFRITVVLADVEGMSYREIADATGVPVGTVRSRLARGRSLLQHALWEHAEAAGLTGKKGEES